MYACIFPERERDSASSSGHFGDCCQQGRCLKHMWKYTNPIDPRSPWSRGGRYGKNIISRFFFLKYHDSTIFITILCHVGLTILSEQCSQNNFPIIKTNPFKVTNYKTMNGGYRPKWEKIQIFVIILSLLLKLRTKIHITNTHNIK